jgi:hypothetical protein
MGFSFVSIQLQIAVLQPFQPRGTNDPAATRSDERTMMVS